MTVRLLSLKLKGIICIYNRRQLVRAQLATLGAYLGAVKGI